MKWVWTEKYIDPLKLFVTLPLTIYWGVTGAIDWQVIVLVILIGTDIKLTWKRECKEKI